MRIRQFSPLLLALLAAAGLPAVQAQPAAQPVAPTAAPATANPTAITAAAAPWTLAQVLKAAQDNLDVAASRSAAEAAKADVLAADHAPAPLLSAKLSSIDLQNGIGDGNILTERRIDKGIGIDWTWERGNKRDLRTQLAQRNASAAQADLEETQTQQLLAASAAFYDLTAAQQRLTLVQSMAASTAQIAQSAARRVGAGDLARQDALRLEIEAERAKGDVLAATLDRQRAALALALLLGRNAADQSLQAVGEWPAPDGVLADNASLDSALQGLVDARSDVRAAAHRTSAAQAAVEGAEAQKSADITWGMSLDHFPGTSTSLLELRLQMPLQWGYQFQGETGRAKAQLAAAQSATDKARRAALLELQGLWAQMRGTAQRSQSYRQEILPRAEHVAEQAELAYTKGALALNDLLDARRTLRATGLEALAAHADHAKAVIAWRLRTQPLASVLAP